MLADTGPLVALIDVAEPEHRRCAAVVLRETRPMVTTWPVVAEAMYLVGRSGGWRGQSRLWQLIRSGRLVVHDLDGRLVERSYELMEQYQDMPMSLADATLVAVGEATRDWRVFTLDDHFRTYRPRGGSFELLPE